LLTNGNGYLMRVILDPRHPPVTVCGSPRDDGCRWPVGKIHTPHERIALMGEPIVVDCPDCGNEPMEYLRKNGRNCPQLSVSLFNSAPRPHEIECVATVLLNADPTQHACPHDTDGDGGCWHRHCDRDHRAWTVEFDWPQP